MILETFAVATLIAHAALLISKKIYTKVADNHEIFNKVITEGLYHVTTRENAEKILASGEIHSSNFMVSMGSGKTFFFPGIPSYDSLCVNVSEAAANYELCAIKVDVKYEELAQFKQREYSDNAIIYEGSYQLPRDRVSIAELVLDLGKEDQVIVRSKSDQEKEMGYHPSEELKKKVNFKNKIVNNIKTYTHGYLTELKTFGNTLGRLLDPTTLCRENNFIQTLNPEEKGRTM